MTTKVMTDWQHLMFKLCFFAAVIGGLWLLMETLDLPKKKAEWHYDWPWVDRSAEGK